VAKEQLSKQKPAEEPSGDFCSLGQCEDILRRVYACFNKFTVDSSHNFDLIIETLAEITEATCVMYHRRAENILELVAGWNLPEGSPRLVEDKGQLCHKFIQSGSREPLIIEDPSKLAELCENAKLTDRVVNSYVVFPVLSGGEVTGVLCMFSEKRVSNDELVLTVGRILGSALGVEELRQSTEKFLKSKVEERIGYERLISEVTSEGLKRQPLSKLFQYTVNRLGEVLDLSRVYLFEYDRKEGMVRSINEWVRQDTEPSLVDELPADQFPWLSDRLLTGQEVLVESRENAPDEALRQLMEAEGTKSVLLLPFNVFGMAFGFIGFDECRFVREWSAGDVELLRAVCRVLTQAIEKERWEEEAVRMERMAAMGRLAGAVAHEINNPLQSILLHLDLLKDSVGKAPTEKSLLRIEEGVQRITDIVWRILQLNREKEEKEAVDINDVAKGVCTLIERQLEQAGGACEFKLKEDIPHAWGSRQLLHQALLNVVMNALESLATNGKIIFSSRSTDHEVEVEVQDNGVGIAKSDLPHIFEPFYSSKGGARPGLGLFICDAIMTSQGGRIELESEKGKGTTVHMYFPIASVA
jgi:signal transduction histidine kinase